MSRIRRLRERTAAMWDALTPDHAKGSHQEFIFAPDPIDERDVMPPTASAHPVNHIPGDREVARNTAEVLVFRILGTPLSVGLTVLQSRVLGPEGRGGYLLAVLGVTLITRLLGEIGTVATNQIARDPRTVGPWTATALRSSVMLGVAGAFLLALSPWVIEYVPSDWIAEVPRGIAALTALAVVPALVSRCLSGILLGAGRIRLWSFIQVLPNGISVCGFYILVIQLDLGVEGAIAGYVAGHAVTAIVALVATYRMWAGWLFRHTPWSYLARLVKLAAAMGLGGFLIALNLRVELTLLQSHDGDAAAGIYGTAINIAEMLWLITTAIATAIWVPMLHESEERAAALVRRSALKGMAYLILGATAVAIAAPFLIPLIYEDRYEPAVTPLFWLLPGIIVYGPVQVLTAYVAVRRGRPGFALVGPVGSLVVTVALAAVFIPRWEATGAAIACTIGYFVGAAGVWVVFFIVSGRSPRFRLRPATTG